MQGRYNNTINKFSLYANFNYAFEDWYDNNVQRIPTSTNPNNAIYLISKTEGKATVDWGDGIIESYDFIKRSTGDYVCAWRTLDSKGKFNDTSLNWSLGTDSQGEYIVPYPNHKYSDGEITERTINIDCTNKSIDIFSTRLIKWSSFPYINSQSLKQLIVNYTSNIKEIPFERISNLKNLETLNLGFLGSILQVIPSSVFGMFSLKSLSTVSVFNLQNIDSCNVRQIKNLTNLESLNFRGCNIKYYIQEFNDLKYLKDLNISSNINNSPEFSETDEINPSVENFIWLDSMSDKVQWEGLYDIKGVDKIKNLYAWSAPKLNVSYIPVYVTQMRSMQTINFGQSLTTQSRVDSFVDSLYDLITNWDQITYNKTAKDGIVNQFYQTDITIYSATYKGDQRPSGVYQEPQGFILGSSNGNPASPMEKIYVLTKNYNQTWTVRPEALARTIKYSIDENYYLDDSVVYSEIDPIYNNEVKKIENEYIN